VLLAILLHWRRFIYLRNRTAFPLALPGCTQDLLSVSIILHRNATQRNDDVKKEATAPANRDQTGLIDELHA